MFDTEPPEPRFIFSIIASLVIVLVYFFFLGAFNPGFVMPEWASIGWGLGMVVVFAIMVQKDQFDAQIGDFMVVAYGPGTLITWGLYWISLAIFPRKKETEQ